MKSEFNGIELTWMHEQIFRIKESAYGVQLVLANLGGGENPLHVKVLKETVDTMDLHLKTIRAQIEDLEACLKGGLIPK